MKLLKRKIVHIVTIFTACILLCSCENEVGHLPLNYTLNNAEKGVVTFSGRCNLGKGWAIMYISHDEKRFGFKPSQDTSEYTASFACNKSTDGLSRTQTVLMELPVGVYTIYTWRLQTDIGLTKAQDFRPISFQVKPNKIAYIGQLQLIATYGSIYGQRLTSSNKHLDMLDIRRKIPNIPEDKFYTEVPVMSKRSIRY
jgi:hypothetical protein